jgi:osmotically-inducible protein OsmY
MQKNLLITLALILFVTTSCVETVVVSSATTGILVTRKKSLPDTAKDTEIAARLKVRLLEKGIFGVSSMVNEGRVLLTGKVKNPKISRTAYDLAWGVKNVKEVIDEIEIDLRDTAYFSAISSEIRDAAITTNIEAKIFFAKDLPSFDYKITTNNKVSYILGVATDAGERQKVLTLAAKARGVNKVVSHVILETDRRRGGENSSVFDEKDED